MPPHRDQGSAPLRVPPARPSRTVRWDAKALRWLAAAGVLLMATGCSAATDGSTGTAPTSPTSTVASSSSQTSTIASSSTVASSSLAPLASDRPVLGPDDLPFPELSDAQLIPEQREALQAVLDDIVAATPTVRGVTAAVVSPNGSWAGAAGVDGAGTPVVPESMTGIASITKSVTAAEVMTLVQQGLIDLDQPATDYLDHPLLVRNPTVRQLLSHTSGVPNFTTDAFIEAAAADPDRSWLPAEALEYATDPIKDPGPAFAYSNSNYLLLGLIIREGHRDCLR